jgi:hypothetical protein
MEKFKFVDPATMDGMDGNGEKLNIGCIFGLKHERGMEIANKIQNRLNELRETQPSDYGTYEFFVDVIELVQPQNIKEFAYVVFNAGQVTQLLAIETKTLYEIDDLLGDMMKELGIDERNINNRFIC